MAGREAHDVELAETLLLSRGHGSTDDDLDRALRDVSPSDHSRSPQQGQAPRRLSPSQRQAANLHDDGLPPAAFDAPPPVVELLTSERLARALWLHVPAKVRGFAADEMPCRKHAMDVACCVCCGNSERPSHTIGNYLCCNFLFDDMRLRERACCHAVFGRCCRPGRTFARRRSTFEAECALPACCAAEQVTTLWPCWLLPLPGQRPHDNPACRHVRDLLVEAGSNCDWRYDGKAIVEALLIVDCAACCEAIMEHAELFNLTDDVAKAVAALVRFEFDRYAVQLSVDDAVPVVDYQWTGAAFQRFYYGPDAAAHGGYKTLDALVRFCRESGYTRALLEQQLKSNRELKAENDAARGRSTGAAASASDTIRTAGQRRPSERRPPPKAQRRGTSTSIVRTGYGVAS